MPPNVSYADIRVDDLRRVAQGRRGFWFSLLLAAALAALAVAASLAGWANAMADLISVQLWPALSLLLALAPALLWLIIFALGERREEGLRRLSFLLLVATAALYLLMARFLIARFFLVDTLFYGTEWVVLVDKLLIISPLEMLLIYLVLLYGAYPSAVFKQLVDGPISGVAAALGVATGVSLLSFHPTAVTQWGPSFLHMVELTLGYGAVGGWLGYFLGQARFRGTNIFYLAAGVLLTIILHALYFFTLDFLDAQSALPAPWAGVLFAFLFALSSFAIIYWRLRQDYKAFMHMAALIEIKTEAATPKSMLADVMHLVEINQIEVRPSPPPPPLDSAANADSADEISSLQQSWKALIAEQEESHDEV